MRLINTETLELHEFFGDEVPPYAILSHTWEKEEVTLQEWTNPSASTPSKTGYKKICMACSLSRRSGHSWLWVDTNCIDKTSSAELSEAINSMFAWYRDASVCYAYLSDVSSDSLTEDPLDEGGLDLDCFSQFQHSRWFTRGWTLQELIAPSNLAFYSREWAFIGGKDDLSLRIAEITGIDAAYLPPPKSSFRLGLNYLDASVATRMSWLSKRTTTRVEDIAYCMLGLFDINMPLLYGEGRKAFLRLQEEIIRKYHDHTIFAWDSEGRAPLKTTLGFLASSPQAFAYSVCPVKQPNRGRPVPFSITNLGVSIDLPVLFDANGAIAVLEAAFPDSHSHLGLHLDSLTWSLEEVQFRTSSPPRPLRICLIISPPKSLFLSLMDDSRVNASNRPTMTATATRRSSRRHGLMLTFSSPPCFTGSWGNPQVEHRPQYRVDPRFMIDSGFQAKRPLLGIPEFALFPDVEEEPHLWLFSQTPSIIKTTSVFIGVRHNMEPELNILFIMSIVTSPGPTDMHHYDFSWYPVPSPGTNYNAFAQEVASLVQTAHNSIRRREVEFKDIMDTSSIDWNRLHPLGPKNPREAQFRDKMDDIEIGCCDVCHPDFQHLRQVLITRDTKPEPQITSHGKHPFKRITSKFRSCISINTQSEPIT